MTKFGLRTPVRAAGIGLPSLLFLLAACAAAPKPLVTEHVVQVPVYQRCAQLPPPAGAPLVGPRCLPGPKCDASTTAFVWDKAAFATLVSNVEELQRWARDTWTFCAPADPDR